MIDFVVPANGSYVVRLQDLISSGGPESYYRLEFDTPPRVAFAWPSIIQQGQSARVTLFGWNLSAGKQSVETSRSVHVEYRTTQLRPIRTAGR